MSFLSILSLLSFLSFYVIFVILDIFVNFVTLSILSFLSFYVIFVIFVIFDIFVIWNSRSALKFIFSLVFMQKINNFSPDFSGFMECQGRCYRHFSSINHWFTKSPIQIHSGWPNLRSLGSSRRWHWFGWLPWSSSTHGKSQHKSHGIAFIIKRSDQKWGWNHR